MKVENIGEFGLIDRIKAFSNSKGHALGIGDDCAIIPQGEREILVSVDALVEGVHFFKNAEPFLLGRKSLAVNISDIAAMAGEPKWAFLSLSLKSGTELSWVDDFLKGFISMADEFGVELLGGDTTKAKETVIGVTIIGENPIGASVKRGTARAGDLVCVSGKIGCSYAGLKALELNLKGYQNFIEAHINPTPRVNEALSIREFATAMIDVSDGFIQDCNHICKQSGVGMKIWWDSIPFCDADFITKEQMLCGGEDYQIAACIDRRFKDKIEKNPYFTIVGEVVEGKEVVIVKDSDVIEIKKCGYEHF
ncbi:thiamine-phosphate kinase [Hippea maritima]|uniref:Thiamine-monophosphate kinase n=1 Tax=Hippea maritima (strain ATCC 700847 / DSM 10411 / MH2) TaxID=760142 RepID=F2LXY8_HIPMA|nr:thiamine-phosphate kinase [Hippea maritima]AEA33253.1 thiamine-monophosphate kinase [Hippea maritima DSM 10411]